MDLLATREHRDLSANSATNAHPDSCRRFIVSSAETIGRRATMEDTLLVHVRPTPPLTAMHTKRSLTRSLWRRADCAGLLPGP
jgi:hypothetical protein